MFRPESLMMSYGYRPEWSEGAIKCPIYQTSTFVFKTAEEGKAYFEIAYGLREKRTGEKEGLIYSRINNPDLEILENRLCLWDEAEDAAVFESGMSAITTTMMEFLKPGDVFLYSTPVYGGTDHFIHHFLKDLGIEGIGFSAFDSREDLIRKIEERKLGDRLKLIYIETPANPTNTLTDIAMCREVADFFNEKERIPIAVDNTYLGPIWQHPLKHGADLVLYSATKYIGGHSDVIAGAVLGSKEHIKRIKGLRTFFGNMAGPWTGWLLMRSLETLKPRMEIQAKNASKIARFLKAHPVVESVHYLEFLSENPGHQWEVFQRQCSSAGAMLSIELKGGEAEAFKFLNNLKLIKLAVSLGSTESLAQHPATMTHAGVDPEDKVEMGITDNLVRLSIGIEHVEDLIWDISQALDSLSDIVKKENPAPELVEQ